jgi:ATP-dependent exoDNAse (exonuclease V) beta subunit
MSSPFADRAARERIRDDLETTLVVEAAAGTGKTSALVERMVAALMRGVARLDRVVAVTFTDAAAGELKLRLREAIERCRQSDDCPAEAKHNLEAALEKLEEARIGTIHSFCADLLRERPVEARVDPRFQVAPEDVARELLGRVFDRWFEEQLADPGEGVRRVLRRKLARNDSPRQLLRAAAQALVDWRDFDASWRHEPFERDAEIDEIMADLGVLAAGAPSLPAADTLARCSR